MSSSEISIARLSITTIIAVFCVQRKWCIQLLYYTGFHVLKCSIGLRKATLFLVIFLSRGILAFWAGKITVGWWVHISLCAGRGKVVQPSWVIESGFMQWWKWLRIWANLVCSIALGLSCKIVMVAVHHPTDFIACCVNISHYKINGLALIHRSK